MAQPAAAMAAVIMERADFAGFVAHHDHTLAFEFEQEVAARLFQLRYVPGEQPRAEEDLLVLGGEHLVGDEIAAVWRVLNDTSTLFHDRKSRMFRLFEGYRVRAAKAAGNLARSSSGAQEISVGNTS